MILFSTLMHLLIDAAFAVAMESVLKFKALIAKATLYKGQKTQILLPHFLWEQLTFYFRSRYLRKIISAYKRTTARI